MKRHMDPNIQKYRKKNIALLYLKTGGGHFSAARALERAITERHENDARALIFDPRPDGAAFAHSILQDGYRFTSHKVGKLWILLYELSKFKALDYIWSFLTYITIRKNMKSFLKEKEIDTVVILHFLLSRPLMWTLRRMKQKINVVRIITDPFTAHSFWFNCPRIPTVVFSKRLLNATVRKWPSYAKNLRLFPPVLKPTLPINEADLQKIRNRYGISEQKKCILVAGGGEGFPSVLRYIKALAAKDPDCHIILVCGKDTALKSRAEKIHSYFPEGSFTVLGFVDVMNELMHIADVVVTKGGPATIMEALQRGNPVIIIQYLYGQEKGNMEYVVRKGFGFYASSPAEFTEVLIRLLSDPEVFSAIRARIRQNPQTNGTAAVADYLISL